MVKFLMCGTDIVNYTELFVSLHFIALLTLGGPFYFGYIF